MMKSGKHFIRSHMTLGYNFSGIRLQDNLLIPVDWEINIDLVVVDKKNKTYEEIEYHAGIIFQKVYFWLDTNLPNILAVDVSNQTDLYIANLTSNIMMYCPGNPDDDMIAQLLHSKISVLSNDSLVVGEITVKASDTSLKYTFSTKDGHYGLPSSTKEYCNNGICRDDKPWWARDDGFCFEFIRPAEMNIDDNELFGNIIDPMSEFKRIISEMSNSEMTPPKEPARIVQVEKWKPKKV